MSAIFGLFNQDGGPVEAIDLGRMAAMLTRRGPERTGSFRAEVVGLGHTRSAPTPEAARERLPLEHPASGCVITADARLDNRDELLGRLDLRARARAGDMGDGELILAAYLAWGQACVEHLLGDFAFAVWDPHRRALFCARDHMGLRPFYYHHTPGRFFAFASEARGVVVLPQAPYRINEGRIADYVISELEGIDKTSTFFEDVFRLPPAHTLIVTPDGMRIRRYWALEPGPELRLPSDGAYAEAFLEVFTEAVRCRLRSAGPAGSMLSGGLDSSSVVAVARNLMAADGRAPLPTVSAVSPVGEDCNETRFIGDVLAMGGLDPSTVDVGQLAELVADVDGLATPLEEPFDGEAPLLRVVYLAARRRGLDVLLDGASADLVLSAGDYLVRTLRDGHGITLLREVAGLRRFWGRTDSPVPQLYGLARAAFTPDAARRVLGPFARRRRHRRTMEIIRQSPVNLEFASEVGVLERLEAMAGHRPTGEASSNRHSRATTVDQPFLTAGRERYDRLAAGAGVEARDPFLDLRVLGLCLALPGDQMLHGGWPKIVLRRATQGLLPDPVRWRRGKDHLGWAFNRALLQVRREHVRLEISD